jgi:3-oxoacyl-[acyl-carrier-protein] synthase-3
MAFVHDFSYALGDVEASVDDAAAAGRTFTAAATLREAGFARHHTCNDGTTAYDLARRAIDPLKPALEGVGAVIYSTCLPLNGNLGAEARFRESRDVKHLMDFPVSHLQADYELDNAFVMGLNQQACTSMLGALRLAKALLVDEPSIGKILCVTADRFPAGAVYEQAYNLISDGASACIVSTEAEAKPAYRIVACHQLTNGALARASDDETVGSYFNYTFRLLSETLARANLRMDDIAYIVPQNTHSKAWVILARLFKYDMDRVFLGSIGTVGHIISSDNVVNLVELEKTGRLRAGDKVLLFMAGFGLNWQAVILEKR